MKKDRSDGHQSLFARHVNLVTIFECSFRYVRTTGYTWVEEKRPPLGRKNEKMPGDSSGHIFSSFPKIHGVFHIRHGQKVNRLQPIVVAVYPSRLWTPRHSRLESLHSWATIEPCVKETSSTFRSVHQT